jgi:hypothetical protein
MIFFNVRWLLLVRLTLGPYHDCRTVGEAHLACLFKGNAAARLATNAIERIFISLVILMFLLAKTELSARSKRKEGKNRRETPRTRSEIHR